jgi:hypothetical protein
MGRIGAAAGGDRRIEATVAGCRAHLLAYAGDPEGSERHLDAAIRTFLELDMTVSAGEVSQAGYYLGLAPGRNSDARQRLELADTGLEAIGETAYLSTNLAMLACLELDAGLIDEAERSALRSASMSADDDLASQWTYRMVLAGVDAARGLFGASIAKAEAAVSLVTGSDFHVQAGDLLARAADVHRLAGDAARARELFGQALDRFRLKGAGAFEAEIERRIATLDSDR